MQESQEPFFDTLYSYEPKMQLDVNRGFPLTLKATMIYIHVLKLQLPAEYENKQSSGSTNLEGLANLLFDNSLKRAFHHIKWCSDMESCPNTKVHQQIIGPNDGRIQFEFQSEIAVKDLHYEFQPLLHF